MLLARPHFNCLDNMRVLLIFLLLFHSFYGMRANERGIEDALSIAKKHWLSVDNVSTRSDANITFVAERIDSSFYVVRRRNTSDVLAPGYIIVPANKAMPEIIAYSESSNFSMEKLPVHIKSWFESYYDMEKLATKDTSALKTWLNSASLGYNDVNPLMQNILWGQDEPYNSECPVVDGSLCPTGCVATALAQIMNYHNWPENGTGTLQYTTETHSIPILFDFEDLKIDWGNINDVYGYKEVPVEYGMKIVTSNSFSFSKMAIDEVYSVARCEVKITSMQSKNTMYFTGDVALVLADEDGKILQQVSKAAHFSNANGSNVFRTLNLPLAIPSYLPNGKYNVYCVLKREDSDFWEIANANANGLNNKNYLSLEKQEAEIYLNGKQYPCATAVDDVETVSTLMKAVGAAVKMDYSPEGSGAYNYNALHGMRENLGYDCDMMLMSASDYTDSQWHKVLQTELSEGRPVYYSGRDSNGGHAFVIDGMQKAPSGLTYYHVNWGWDGWCNGYYLLNMLRPEFSGTGGLSSSNYSNGANMIIGIMPEDGINDVRIMCGGLSLYSDTVLSGQNLYPCVTSLQASSDFRGSLTLMLYNINQQDQEPIRTYNESKVHISDGKGITNHKIMCSVPDGVPSGDYELRIECYNSDGVQVDVDAMFWPQIHIKDVQTGGELSSAKQYIGVQNVEFIIEDTPYLRIVMDIDKLWNLTSRNLAGKMTMVISDANGVVLTPTDEQRTLILNGYAKKENIHINASFAKDMPDGKYFLSLGFRMENTDKWTLGYKIDENAETLWDSLQLSLLSIPFEVYSGNAHFLFGVVPGITNLKWTSIKNIPDKLPMRGVYYNINGWLSFPSSDGVYIYDKKKVIIKTK